MLRSRISPPSLTRHRQVSQPTKRADFSAARSGKASGSWKEVACALMAATGVIASPAQAAETAQEFITAQDIFDRECRLVVLDNFKDGALSHGEKVVASADLVGLGKEAVEIQLDQSGIRLAAVKASTGDNVALSKADQDPQIFEAALQKTLEEKAVTHYSIMSTEVEALKEAGFTHSVANFSQGLDEAQMVESLYKTSRVAWSSDKPNLIDFGTRRTKNFARLFQLDADKILSQDPNVSGPARHQFQQALIDHVHQVVTESDVIAEARQRWETSVESFEADHNSVVIAAGNSARLGKTLESLNGGRELELPETFYNNLLEIDDVTSVGSITPVKLPDYQEPIEIISTFSSPSTGVDIYANGEVFMGSRKSSGTSFAAPKTSAGMTDVHCDNPDFTSDQVEAYIADHHSRDLTPWGKGLTVLNVESF